MNGIVRRIIIASTSGKPRFVIRMKNPSRKGFSIWVNIFCEYLSRENEISEIKKRAERISHSFFMFILVFLVIIS